MYDMRKPGTPAATPPAPPTHPTYAIRAPLPRVTVRPRLAGEVAADWLTKESLTFLAPDGRANVIASSEPLSAAVDATRYAEVQGDQLRREFPAYRELSFERAVVFGDLLGWVRVFTWVPPEGVPITQVQAYAAEQGRGFTATATTTSTAYASLRDELWAVVTSVRLTA